jgi:hypothetical protein
MKFHHTILLYKMPIHARETKKHVPHLNDIDIKIWEPWCTCLNAGLLQDKEDRRKNGLCTHGKTRF